MSSLTIPLTGMTAATARLNRAAETVVQSTTPATANGGTEKPAAPATKPPLLAENGGVRAMDDTGLTKGLVDMKMAEHAYKANVAAFKTMDDTRDALLEMTL